MGQIYPISIQLVIPILVVELNKIVKSQIIVSYTKKGSKNVPLYTRYRIKEFCLYF